MARAGAFDGVDAAMMMHPSEHQPLTTMPCICIAEVDVEYRGQAAHASAMPHRGINALDGARCSPIRRSSKLRQHIRATERIHGIVTDGGLAPNIVPELAAGDFYVRAATRRGPRALKPRVRRCFEAGATGSGCEVEVKLGRRRLSRHLSTNGRSRARFQRNAESARPQVLSDTRSCRPSSSGSTDMGNVS